MNQTNSPARTAIGSFLSSYSRSRRLEDRIRELCSQAVASTNAADAKAVLRQLRAAIHEHVGRLRSKLAADSVLPRERRRSRI
jgi:hypothetical protein